MRCALRSLADRVSRGVAMFAFLAAMLLIGGFLVFARAVETWPVDRNATADGIVVLTGDVQRINDAATLMVQGRGKRMLITGVHTGTTWAHIAHANPVAANVRCCVDLDYRARSTVGNAIETRRWAENHGFNSLIVVTSTYHMPRTLLELEHVLPGTKLLPHPVAAAQYDSSRWHTDRGALLFLAREYIKYLAAFTRTSVEADPEHSPFAALFGGKRPLS
jgi:uncharacterized SAM-binding protein YcdF (DUF218 family)